MSSSAFNNAFRERAKVRRARVGWALAAAAVVLVVGVLIGVKQGSIFPKRPQNAELAWVDDTVVVPSENAFRQCRGSRSRFFSERLPLRLTVQLPIGSKAGAYELQLKMNERTVVSTGGNAEIRNGTTAFVARSICRSSNLEAIPW